MWATILNILRVFSTLYTYFHIFQLKFCEINLPRKFILVRVALWGGGRRSTAVDFLCDHILTPERNSSSVCSAFRARTKQWIQLCSMNSTDCFNECYRPFIEPLIEAWLRRAKQQNDVLDQNYRKMSNMPNQKLIWYDYITKLWTFFLVPIGYTTEKTKKLCFPHISGTLKITKNI